MTDRGDIETRQVPVNFEEVPFKLHRGYSKKESEVIRNFMHEDFPNITYRGSRDEGVVIEYPPENICSHDMWKTILDTVFLPEWESFDPKIRRQKKAIIRFVDFLYDNALGLNSGGNGIITSNENWFRIPFKGGDGGNISVEILTFKIMHELTETDFWSKTQKDDKEAMINTDDEINAFKSGEKEYRNLLDEKIANRRALRAIKRMWPDIDYVDPKYVYEEDK